MSVQPVVRRADAGDFAQVLDIDQRRRGDIASQRGGEAWLSTHPSLHDTAASGLARNCFVGLIDDVVIGYAIWDLHEMIDIGRVIRVERIHVLAEARELGFGDALLSAIVDEGRVLSCQVIEGEALPGDRDTKNLYERAGITARSITVSKRLSD